MRQNYSGSTILRFGVFELDLADSQLRRSGALIKLQPQPFKLLSLLVRRAGQVVTREEIQQALWGGQTFVDFERGINFSVGQIRAALGDEAQTPRYLETLQRRGYRFIAPIEDGASQFGEAVHVPGGQPLTERSRWVWPAFAAIAAVAAWAGFSLLRHSERKKPAEPFQTMRITRLTTSGKAKAAAISPDGKYVAYASGDPTTQGLWVQQLATHSDIQIVPAAEGQLRGLTFSRDGNYIWYVRFEKSDTYKAALYVVPAFGGPAKKIVNSLRSGAGLSPDGARLAFVREDPGRDESALIVANLDGSGERKLATHRFRDLFSSGAPAWAPDGGTIAVGARSSDSQGPANALAVEVAGGGEKPIGSERWSQVDQVAWLADGSGLVVSAQQSSSIFVQLWEISYTAGQARRITNDFNDYWGGGVSVTSDSSTIVAVENDLLSNLWIVPQGETSRARQISFGTGRWEGVAGLDWTADGRIVYAKLPSGTPELWVMDADGSHSQQLVRGSVDWGRSVSACPDGRYIVFSSKRTGTFEIWRVDSDGGNLKQLTRGGDYRFPSCSPDGKWVVFTSLVGGRSLWKIPIDGGMPLQLTHYDSRISVVSPDGKWIGSLRSEGGRSNIDVVPFEGGRPWKTFDYSAILAFDDAMRWTPDSRAVAYIDTRKGVSNVWAQPLAGGPPKQITDFNTGVIFDFAWSPEGKLALARGTQTSDVVLISNFK